MCIRDRDWRAGAAYFESQLIDYDVSSNWGNWAYIAGVGNDPQSGRNFNLAKQEEQYDKDKRYQQLWNMLVPCCICDIFQIYASLVDFICQFL